jgi:hypothetical protein
LSSFQSQFRPSSAACEAEAGDFQRHYDEKGYNFDWVLETNPLAYFTALVGLSKIVRVPADVSHRDGSKPRSVDEILQRVEEQTGKEGRAAFEKF